MLTKPLQLSYSWINGLLSWKVDDEGTAAVISFATMMISRFCFVKMKHTVRLVLDRYFLFDSIGDIYGIYEERCSLRSLLDVLWGQPIKLIQVFSTSEFYEYWWNNIFNIFCPFHFVQGLRSLEHWLHQKLSMKTLEQKFRLLIKRYVFWSPNISRKVIIWTLNIQL